MDVRAAVLAGIAAGVVSTVAEIVLWAAFTDALPDILWRDSRLAAAIVMGPRVIEATRPDAIVSTAAGAVHFLLSVVYAMLLAALIARRRMPVSIAIGVAFGACLYAVNMYVFTAVFPWFAATRDAITAAAHLVFGASAAVTYRALVRTRA